MEKDEVPWSKGAFFICEKCGRRKDSDPALHGFADELKGEFKSKFKEMGHGKDIRVMVSGCIDVCPPQKQAAAWCPTNGTTETLVFAKSERSEVFDWLKKKL